MRKSWLTAASVLAAATVEGQSAQAQLFTPSTTSLPFGNVRTGTSSGSQSFTVMNDSALDSGSIDVATTPFSGGPFPLSTKNNDVTTASYVFSPTVAGAANDPIGISATKKTTTQTATVNLSGTGVGPVYSSSPTAGSTIDFGNITPGESGVHDLMISNTSTDSGGPTLTGLTLLAAGLTPGGTGFSLGNSLPSTPLEEGNTFDLKIDFTALSMLGLETADLKITTDQGAPTGLGGAGGDTFDYTLKATVVAAAVPEPASLGLLASGLAGAAAAVGLRRRRPR
jgi:hypothetical protein